MDNNHDSIAEDAVMTEQNAQEEPIFTPQGEIINGEEYAKNTTDPSAKAIIKYLSSILKQYHLSHRPLDQLSDPYEVLMVSGVMRPWATTIRALGAIRAICAAVS